MGEFGEIYDKERVGREVVPPHCSQFKGCVERGMALA